jgi:hypothetical protein
MWGKLIETHTMSRSTIVVLLREDEDKDDVARTLLARALLLQVIKPPTLTLQL